MEAFKTKTKIKNHSIKIDKVPFKDGEEVEVTVNKVEKAPHNSKYPLRGTLLKYEDPFEPAVPPEDWEANQ